MSRLLALVTTNGLSDAGAGAGYSVSQTAPQLIGAIIAVILGFLGILFLVLIIYGGITWMTSLGNEKTVTKAKNIIVTATVGLAIILGSYAISYYVISNLVTATTDRNSNPSPWGAI